MDSPEGQHGTSKEPGRRLRDRGLSALLLLALPLLVVLAGFILFDIRSSQTEIIETQQELIEIQDSRLEIQEGLIANLEELIANIETLIETRDEIMELLGVRP